MDEEVHGTKRMKQSPSKLSAAGPSGHWNVANDMGTDDITPSSSKFPSSSSSLGPLDDSSQEDGMDTEAAANKYSHCMKPGCSCRVDANDANLTGASFDYYSDLLAGAIRRTSVAAIRPITSTGTFCIDVFMIQTKHKKAAKAREAAFDKKITKLMNEKFSGRNREYVIETVRTNDKLKQAKAAAKRQLKETRKAITDVQLQGKTIPAVAGNPTAMVLTENDAAAAEARADEEDGQDMTMTVMRDSSCRLRRLQTWKLTTWRMNKRERSCRRMATFKGMWVRLKA